jgi:hypothetical protein
VAIARAMLPPPAEIDQLIRDFLSD